MNRLQNQNLSANIIVAGIERRAELPLYRLEENKRGKYESMKLYVWLFPIIFIFHDMEEIIGFGIWLRKNKQILGKKYPRILKTYKDFSTEGFSLAVYEELALCIAISTIAYFCDIQMIWCMWLGSFIACTLHFVVHMGQSIMMKQYVPAVITSMLCFPISVWIIYKCFLSIEGFGACEIVCMIIGLVIVAINLKLVQKLIGWFTRKAGLDTII